MHRVILIFVAAALAGCNLFRESETSSIPDVTEDQGTGDIASEDVGGGSDVGADLGPCESETPEQLCARLGAECGALSAPDNCGFDRAVTCGGCDVATQTCGALAPNQCDCVPEDDTTFCQRQGKDCGAFTAADNCGGMRTVDCGTCAGGEACGEQTANVCGCPCLVDGTCRPAGSANPANACEVCDPAASTTSWTVDVGADCDDRNACTESTTCSATGQCVGTDLDCSGLGTDCRAAACDPSAGCFAVDLNDVACTSDGDDCTTDVCMAGTCTHPLAAGKCVIAGTCYDDGTTNPTNPCERCDVAASATAWTDNDGGGCADADGLACTSGACVGGLCVSGIDPGSCVISNTCVGAGTVNPADDCEVCNPASSTTAWSSAANGTPCVAEAMGCTVGACQGGTCTGSVGAGCAIAMACWAEGVLNPANDCETCDPGVNAAGWTPLPANTTCTDGDDYVCSFGACDGNGACDLAFDPGYCIEEDEGICVRDGDGIGGLDCFVCDAAMGTVVPAADGTPCTGEDALSCTTGECRSGWCHPAPVAGSCAIGGVCYPQGAVNPGNACQSCDTAISQTAWTARANGTMCGSGLTCSAGECGASACAPLGAGNCLINGVCYAAGEASPSNPCDVCDPATSQSAFTPSEGECDAGAPCASFGICGALSPGVCFAIPDEGWCFIEGVCFQEDDVNPAASCEACAPELLPFAWWPRDGFCSVAGVCAADGQANPGSSCEVCDADNPLTWSIRPSSCKIGGTCYDAGEAQPGNACRVCDPSKAQTQWSNAPNSTICGGDTCTCDNGTCDTSGGC